MGFLDKAKDMLGKHDDKVDQAMDKAGGKAKERFQGHDQQIDKVTQAGKDYDFSGRGKAAGEPAPGGTGATPPPERAPDAAPPPGEGQPPRQ